MAAYMGHHKLVWQKLAVNVNRDTSLQKLQYALRSGVTFFHIRCGQYSSKDYNVLLNRCQDAIKRNAEASQPWTLPTGIICELTGPKPCIKFGSGITHVNLTEGQIITFTADASYENQLFDEVKYVSNFGQLQACAIGDVLSIGFVKLSVDRNLPNFVTCKVTHGGRLDPSCFITSDSPRFGNISEEDNDLYCHLCISECERIFAKGCRFAILPIVDFKFGQKMMELLRRSKMVELGFQIISAVDEALASSCEINTHIIQAFATKDLAVLKIAQKTSKPVLFEMDTEYIPESIEEADIITVEICDINRIQDYLKNVNRKQLELLLQSDSGIASDERHFVKCLDYAGKQAEANAIILTYTKNTELVTAISLANPFRFVFVVKRSFEEMNGLLLRKYIIPFIVLEQDMSQQRVIRCVIAYGKRFGYLHSGNCIVTGFEIDPDDEKKDSVLGLEMRYVPLNQQFEA